MADLKASDMSTNKKVKNPLLCSTVTGLSLDDFIQNAVLLPVIQNNPPTVINDAPPKTEKSSSANKLLFATNQPEIEPLIFSQFDRNRNAPPPPPSSAADMERKVNLQEIDLNKNEEDDFDFESYYSRLHTAPRLAQETVTEDRINENSEAFSEIDLHSSFNEFELPEAREGQSIAADLASNLSQLPNVLPHVANTVFSSLSSIWNRPKVDAVRSVAAEPARDFPTNHEDLVGAGDGLREFDNSVDEGPCVPVPLFDTTNLNAPGSRKGSASNVSVKDDADKENKDAMDGGTQVIQRIETNQGFKDSSSDGSLNMFRLGSKKKKTYAHVPGLTLGEAEYPTQRSYLPPPGITIPPLPLTATSAGSPYQQSDSRTESIGGPLVSETCQSTITPSTYHFANPASLPSDTAKINLDNREAKIDAGSFQPCIGTTPFVTPASCYSLPHQEPSSIGPDSINILGQIASQPNNNNFDIVMSSESSDITKNIDSVPTMRLQSHLNTFGSTGVNSSNYIISEQNSGKPKESHDLKINRESPNSIFYNSNSFNSNRNDDSNLNQISSTDLSRPPLSLPPRMTENFRKPSSQNEKSNFNPRSFYGMLKNNSPLVRGPNDPNTKSTSNLVPFDTGSIVSVVPPSIYNPEKYTRQLEVDTSNVSVEQNSAPIVHSRDITMSSLNNQNSELPGNTAVHYQIQTSFLNKNANQSFNQHLYQENNVAVLDPSSFTNNGTIISDPTSSNDSLLKVYERSDKAETLKFIDASSSNVQTSVFNPQLFTHSSNNEINVGQNNSVHDNSRGPILLNPPTIEQNAKIFDTPSTYDQNVRPPSNASVSSNHFNHTSKFTDETTCDFAKLNISDNSSVGVLPPRILPSNNGNRFRLTTNKRLQYYSGPINGQQPFKVENSNPLMFPHQDSVPPQNVALLTPRSVSNQDIIQPQNLALFTPEMDSSQDVLSLHTVALLAPESGLNSDVGSPQNVTVFTPESVPFDVSRPTVLQPQLSPYLPPDPAKDYCLLKSQTQQINNSTGAFEENKVINDQCNQNKNGFGFGLKALEKIQEKVNLNTLQNAVTSFFDPDYFSAQKKLEMEKTSNNIEDFSIQTDQSYNIGNNFTTPVSKSNIKFGRNTFESFQNSNPTPVSEGVPFFIDTTKKQMPDSYQKYQRGETIFNTNKIDSAVSKHALELNMIVSNTDNLSAMLRSQNQQPNNLNDIHQMSALNQHLSHAFSSGMPDAQQNMCHVHNSISNDSLNINQIGSHVKDPCTKKNHSLHDDTESNVLELSGDEKRLCLQTRDGFVEKNSDIRGFDDFESSVSLPCSEGSHEFNTQPVDSLPITTAMQTVSNEFNNTNVSNDIWTDSDNATCVFNKTAVSDVLDTKLNETGYKIRSNLDFSNIFTTSSVDFSQNIRTKGIGNEVYPRYTTDIVPRSENIHEQKELPSTIKSNKTTPEDNSSETHDINNTLMNLANPISFFDSVENNNVLQSNQSQLSSFFSMPTANTKDFKFEDNSSWSAEYESNDTMSADGINREVSLSAGNILSQANSGKCFNESVSDLNFTLSGSELNQNLESGSLDVCNNDSNIESIDPTNTARLEKHHDHNYAVSKNDDRSDVYPKKNHESENEPVKTLTAKLLHEHVEKEVAGMTQEQWDSLIRSLNVISVENVSKTDSITKEPEQLYTIEPNNDNDDEEVEIDPLYIHLPIRKCRSDEKIIQTLKGLSSTSSCQQQQDNSNFRRVSVGVVRPMQATTDSQLSAFVPVRDNLTSTGEILPSFENSFVRSHITGITEMDRSLQQILDEKRRLLTIYPNTTISNESDLNTTDPFGVPLAYVQQQTVLATGSSRGEDDLSFNPYMETDNPEENATRFNDAGIINNVVCEGSNNGSVCSNRNQDEAVGHNWNDLGNINVDPNEKPDDDFPQFDYSNDPSSHLDKIRNIHSYCRPHYEETSTVQNEEMDTSKPEAFVEPANETELIEFENTDIVESNINQPTSEMGSPIIDKFEDIEEQDFDSNEEINLDPSVEDRLFSDDSKSVDTLEVNDMRDKRDEKLSESEETSDVDTAFKETENNQISEIELCNNEDEKVETTVSNLERVSEKVDSQFMDDTEIRRKLSQTKDDQIDNNINKEISLFSNISQGPDICDDNALELPLNLEEETKVEFEERDIVSHPIADKTDDDVPLFNAFKFGVPETETCAFNMFSNAKLPAHSTASIQGTKGSETNLKPVGRVEPNCTTPQQQGFTPFRTPGFNASGDSADSRSNIFRSDYQPTNPFEHSANLNHSYGMSSANQFPFSGAYLIKAVPLPMSQSVEGPVPQNQPNNFGYSGSLQQQQSQNVQNTSMFFPDQQQNRMQAGYGHPPSQSQPGSTGQFQMRPNVYAPISYGNHHASNQSYFGYPQTNPNQVNNRSDLNSQPYAYDPNVQMNAYPNSYNPGYGSRPNFDQQR